MKKKLATVIALCAVIGTQALDIPAAEAAAKKDKAVAAKRQATAHKTTANTTRTTRTAKAAKATRIAKRAQAEESDGLALQSSAVLVQDQTTGAVLFEKNSGAVLPIASITKLMTAMVVLDAQLPLDEQLAIGDEDIDALKGTHSRLKVGTQLAREDMLLLALMSSENRAASALARHYPGGTAAFVAAMNRKASDIGLADTRFEDPTGLTAANVSSARDLTRMVAAASHYPLIRELSTTPEHTVVVGGRPMAFRNTNTLVRSPVSGWDIAVSKTGYIREAGKCLVMQAWLKNKPVVIVLLDSWGKLTRIGDANRIKRWIEQADSSAGRRSAG